MAEMRRREHVKLKKWCGGAKMKKKVARGLVTRTNKSGAGPAVIIDTVERGTAVSKCQ